MLYGDTADGSWYFDLLRNGTDISDIRDGLIFGQAAIGAIAARTLAAAVAALGDEAEICGCNGVCKGKIVARDRRQGCSRSSGARAHQGVGLVRLVHRPGRELLALTLGDDYSGGAEGEADVQLHRLHP